VPSYRSRLTAQVSALDASNGLEVDQDTKDLLNALGMSSIPVSVVAPVVEVPSRGPPRGDRRGPPGARRD